MKLAASISLAVAASQAGPFHKGASWEWVVHDPSLASPARRIARVLDSTWSADRRILTWKLEVTESVRSAVADTALLQELFDSPGGSAPRRIWAKGSPALPLEPRSFDPVADSILGAQPYRSMSGPVAAEVPWGFGSWVGGTQGKICPSVASSIRSRPNLLQLQDFCGEGSTNVWTLPNSGWNETNGWGDVRWWTTSGTLGSVVLVDWILAGKDGVSRAANPLGRILSPIKGAEWIWERRDIHVRHSGPSRLGNAGTTVATDSVTQVVLRFPDSLSDSAGWSRIDAIQDPAAGEMVSIRQHARWNPEKVSRFANPGTECQDLLEGFRTDWADAKIGSIASRRSHRSVVNFAMARSSSSASFFGKLRAGGGFDSLSCETSSSQDGAIEPTTDSRVTTYRLMRIDQSMVRLPTSTESVASSVRTVSDLAGLARRHPAASVTIRDMRGSVRTERLDELMVLRNSRVRGVSWIEIRLPDGSIRRGSLLH